MVHSFLQIISSNSTSVPEVEMWFVHLLGSSSSLEDWKQFFGIFEEVAPTKRIKENQTLGNCLKTTTFGIFRVTLMLVNRRVMCIFFNGEAATLQNRWYWSGSSYTDMSYVVFRCSIWQRSSFRMFQAVVVIQWPHKIHFLLLAFQKTYFSDVYDMFDETTIFGWVYNIFFWRKGCWGARIMSACLGIGFPRYELSHVGCLMPIDMARKYWGEMALTTHNGNTGVSGTRGGKGQDVACLILAHWWESSEWSTRIIAKTPSTRFPKVREEKTYPLS